MIAIIDYGLSNLLSIKRAVMNYCSDVVVTSDIDVINRADKLILPGVGAFDCGMEKIFNQGLDLAIKNCVKEGKPILGICLGMQMLFDRSEEGERYSGLGLIPGAVKKIKEVNSKGERIDIPHIGWEKLIINNSINNDWPDILADVDICNEVYFVHSYAGYPIIDNCLVAYSDYQGNKITAIVQNEKVVGCQFHPEKSGKVGLTIIKNFIENF